MKLVSNSNLNFDFLESELQTNEELMLVNPSATLPFDQDYWRNLFTENENPAYSCYFEYDGKVIGHTAIKKFKDRDNRIFLCFVYLMKAYRGLGMAHEMYSLTEHFLKEKFQVTEYWLNVRNFNASAIRSYEKFGFQKISEMNQHIQMIKRI